jgi:hypothetical protein
VSAYLKNDIIQSLVNTNASQLDVLTEHVIIIVGGLGWDIDELLTTLIIKTTLFHSLNFSSITYEGCGLLINVGVQQPLFRSLKKSL